MHHDAEAARAGTKQDEPSGYRQRIEAEHRLIRSSLERLVQIADLARLEQTLQELEPLLASHFAHEEAEGGIHEVIGLTAPGLVPSVEELFDEHKELLELLQRLLSEVARARAVIFEDRDRLVEGLRSHEARETELFSQAAYSELGAGD